MKLTNLGWVSVVFALLKLMGYINLAWWIILLPFEFQFCCIVLLGIINLIQWCFESERERRQRKAREALLKIAGSYK
jgi:hypothetical protein